MEMTDEERDELIKYSERPELQPELKHEAKCYLDKVVKDGLVKNKDGTKLRWALMKVLQEFPMMATYTKYVLDYAKEQGFIFKEDVESLK